MSLMRKNSWLMLLPLVATLLWAGSASSGAAGPTVIYDSAVGKQNPGLALSSNGDAVAVWAEGNTLQASVRPSGGSRSAPRAAATTPSTGRRAASAGRPAGRCAGGAGGGWRSNRTATTGRSVMTSSSRSTT